MLQDFSIVVYVLLDLVSTLSVVTPLVDKKFGMLPDVLIEPFLVTTSAVDLIVERVYRNLPIMLSNRVILVDLLELDMFDFDVIL